MKQIDKNFEKETLNAKNAHEEKIKSCINI